MKIKGFTLIELLVVVGVMGVIMITVMNVLFNSFRAKSRTELIQRLEIDGSNVLGKIKANIINAIPETITCNGDNITFANKLSNGEECLIACDEGSGRIASQSAENGRFELLSSGVEAYDCGNFVSCELSATGEVLSVGVSFGLRAQNTGEKTENTIQRKFEGRIMIRD